MKRVAIDKWQISSMWNDRLWMQLTRVVDEPFHYDHVKEHLHTEQFYGWAWGQ